jgi:urease accessory protein
VTVVLVQTVAGPLGGDVTDVEIDVSEGAALEVVGNAATLAFPAADPARIDVRARVGAGGRLLWRPEPLILAAGCDLNASFRLYLEPGAAALTRELVVLGRHGEEPGRYRGELRCELDGVPLLHDAVEIDGVAQTSAAQLAGARAFASLALLGKAPGHVPRGHGRGQSPVTSLAASAPEECVENDAEPSREETVRRHVRRGHVRGQSPDMSPRDASELELAGAGRVVRILAPDAATLRRRVAAAEERLLRVFTDAARTAGVEDGGGGQT